MSIKVTADRLIEMVTPDVNHAIAKAKYMLKKMDDEDTIHFYAKAIKTLLWARDGPSQSNHKMIERLVNDKRKAVHPFPYVEKCYRSGSSTAR